MEEDLFVAIALFLLAHEVERVAERLDRRLDRRLDVFALQLEAVDLALNVFEARFGFLEKDLRLRFGVADESLSFFFGVLPDVVGELLRGHERIAQVALGFAVFVQHRFHPRQVLAQPIGFAQRLLVVVGDGGQKRGDLHLVEAAEGRPETLLPEVERADVHSRYFS